MILTSIPKNIFFVIDIYKSNVSIKPNRSLDSSKKITRFLRLHKNQIRFYIFQISPIKILQINHDRKPLSRTVICLRVSKYSHRVKN